MDKKGEKIHCGEGEMWDNKEINFPSNLISYFVAKTDENYPHDMQWLKAKETKKRLLKLKHKSGQFM
jgi:hypothetical protein